MKRWPIPSRRAALCAAALALLSGSSLAGAAPAKNQWVAAWRAANPVWRGVHLGAHTDQQTEQLLVILPKLSDLGVNVVVLEVNYAFDFKSHPEVRTERFITKAAAQRLTQACRDRGIRLIPQINCLGHQSWAKATGSLLVKYPQFDETPGQFPENKSIYCRSWCPRNPEVYKVVLPFIDELAEAFDADAFHVGMDEVFLIASDYCPRCRGGDPAKLFARAVNDLHKHIVRKRRLEMLLWGDRLLDAKTMGYSEWEASKNATAPAIELVPKDVIICDWHYGKRAEYPSVRYLLEKGFRVWPAGWQPLEASQAFSAFARQQKNPRMLGYLCTTWGKVKIPDMPEWPPIREVLPEWKQTLPAQGGTR